MTTTSTAPSTSSAQPPSSSSSAPLGNTSESPPPSLAHSARPSRSSTPIPISPAPSTSSHAFVSPSSGSSSSHSSEDAFLDISSSSSSSRHHYRTEQLVEASQIPPRELRWACRGEEGQGLMLEEAGGRSWSSDVECRDEGVPCPQAHDIRTVHSSSVRVEPQENPVPRSPHEAHIRRRSLFGDPDSPE